MIKFSYFYVVVVRSTYFVTLDADDFSGLVQCLVFVGVRSDPDLRKYIKRVSNFYLADVDPLNSNTNYGEQG